MNSRAGWAAVIAAAVLVGLSLVCCAAVVFGGYLLTRPISREAEPHEDVPNGELIYFAGRNESGERIPFEGGPMWLYMRGGSCAACHGADGRGGVPVMMGTEIPGDIRYHHLLEEEHEEEGEEEHPPYTDELIRQAITLGLNPAGEPLDPTMPRWRMSEQDLNDLIEFLKTLDSEH